ncbi:MAG: aldo/keto reductase [Thermomicrobiales bacterium]
MEYVKFGDSGVMVSRMALGLGLREQYDEAEAERMIHRALDRGITLFDCANVYGLGDTRSHIGKSEEILGRAIKGVRDEVVITSKVCQPIGDGPNDKYASRYHIMREIDRSLKRLGTDHVDVYLLHIYDDSTPLDEQFRASKTSCSKARYGMSVSAITRRGRFVARCISRIASTPAG